MLHWIDSVIIAVYLVGTISIGILFRGRQSDAEDYFTASGRMGSWFSSLLVGLSLAATLFSGISFIMYPSVIYGNGVAILFGLTCFPITWAILKFWFLPRFLIAEVKHPYDIVENALGHEVRTVAAAMYILLRIGWMATLIYAPTLAVMTAAGLESHWFWGIVLVIGISSTVYTTLGGITSVIITDAIQFLVIALGIVLTVVFVLIRLPVGVGEIMGTLRDSGTFKLDLSLDPTKSLTLVSIIIGVNINNLANYVADQMSLQRYLAAGDVKSANRSFVFNMWGALGVLFLLALVGLSLRTWYHYLPDANLPEKADEVFPYFISKELPIGIGGLLLAAILAATVSSITSGINTLAATITFDYRARMRRQLSPQQQLRFGRVCSLIVGIAATLIAGVVHRLGNIFEITQTVLGLFCGPLCACVIFAMMGKPMNRWAVISALIVGTFAGAVVAWSPWYALWVAPVSFSTAILWGIGGSCVLGHEDEPS